jgi:hypothetical protein
MKTTAQLKKHSGEALLVHSNGNIRHSYRDSDGDWRCKITGRAVAGIVGWFPMPKFKIIKVPKRTRTFKCAI